MAMHAAIYLAHLNPLTKAHADIIYTLKKDYEVYVFPVVFLKKKEEVTTKSFPFPYPVRKKMIEAVFGKNSNVSVFPDYSFDSPYIKYLPPLISPYSWILRGRILRNVKEKTFISYTGDASERLMLKLYFMNPTVNKRLAISASEVKKILYAHAHVYETRCDDWKDMVPEPVVRVILENWQTVRNFARLSDETISILGTKFPKDGCFSI
jgi:phosphopantetheine adenylyltransferase